MGPMAYARHRATPALLLLALLTIAGAWWWWRREPPPIPAQGGKAMAVLVTGVPFFRQTDPRWGGDRLGGSGESLFEAGCTLTCVAMALVQAGTATDPGDLNRRLLTRDGYTASGLLNWRALSDCFDPPPAVSFPAPDHDLIDATLAQNTPLLARIRLGGGAGAIHWVLVVGKRGRDYLIHDPLLTRGPTVLADCAPRIEALRVVTR